MYKMQKTKRIYKSSWHQIQRNPQKSSENEYNFTVSPLLHEQLFLSIINYQSIQNQDQSSFSIEDFVVNLHTEYYRYCDPEECQNLNQDRIRKGRLLQEINLQYRQNMQKMNKEKEPKPKKVRFDQQESVKYFKEDDPPIKVSNYEEFCSSSKNYDDYLQRCCQ